MAAPPGKCSLAHDLQHMLPQAPQTKLHDVPLSTGSVNGSAPYVHARSPPCLELESSGPRTPKLGRIEAPASGRLLYRALMIIYTHHT